MRLTRAARRPGYTLLEVMLAAVIAVIMMAALYVAMDIQIRQMEEGRSRIDKSNLARFLFAKISSDLTPSLAPTVPQTSSAAGSGGAGGGGSGAGAGAGGSSGAGSGGGAGSGSTASGGSTSSSTTTTSTSGTTGNVVFQIGVQGDSSSVAIFLTTLNRQVVSPPDDGSGNIPIASDIRRVCYFMPASGGGLARQEIRLATSDQVDAMPSDVDDYTKVIAQEVKDFSVRYFDGSSWQDSWDGATPGPDGKTPQGPPRAIEITLSLQLPDSDEVKTFKHVIAFPAAPGTADSSSTSTTTGSSSP